MFQQIRSHRHAAISQWEQSSRVQTSWQVSVEKPSGEEEEKVNKSPLKQIAAIIHTPSFSEPDSNASEKMNEQNYQMANLLSIKMPICYSVNQIEVLQTLGTFSFFAAQSPVRN